MHINMHIPYYLFISYINYYNTLYIINFSSSRAPLSSTELPVYELQTFKVALQCLMCLCWTCDALPVSTWAARCQVVLRANRKVRWLSWLSLQRATPFITDSCAITHINCRRLPWRVSQCPSPYHTPFPRAEDGAVSAYARGRTPPCGSRV